MLRFGLFLVLMGLACLAAAAFGAVHNQISYSLAPVYFHELKFAQFAIPAEFHDRIGEAIVGVTASWWMGPIVGLVPLALGAFVSPTRSRQWCLGARAILWVVLSALAVACAVALAVLLLIQTAPLDLVPQAGRTSDPLGFVRAAILHEASYAAGFAGIIIASLATWRNRKDM